MPLSASDLAKDYIVQAIPRIAESWPRTLISALGTTTGVSKTACVIVLESFAKSCIVVVAAGTMAMELE